MSSLNKQKLIVASGALTLAINAAEGRLMLALGRAAQPSSGGAGQTAEFFFAQDWQALAQGAELLAPMLDAALRALGLEPAHIGRIAAVNGPGSFTGLRLATVTAAALARNTRALQAPLSCTSLLASAALHGVEAAGAPMDGLVQVITHARRGLVYLQSFAHTGAPFGAPVVPHEQSPLMVKSLAEAAAILQASPPALLIGSGLERNRAFFEEALAGQKRLRMLPTDFARLQPDFLLRYALALPDEFYSNRDIEPLYLRPSDAEENLPHIAAKLGLGAEDSRRRLEALLATDPAAQQEA